MQKGNDSPVRGWVMSEILKKAQDKYGPDGYIFGRDYIVNEHCGIKEPKQLPIQGVLTYYIGNILK